MISVQMSIKHPAVSMEGGATKGMRVERRCSACKRGELERVRTPAFLRVFRALPGLHPRSYQCDICHQSVVLWRNSDHRQTKSVPRQDSGTAPST